MSKKPMATSAKGNAETSEKSTQLQRFKEMARKLDADESLDALDRAFAQLDTKRRAEPKKAK